MTSVLDRPAPPPDLTVPYGPRPEQVIDLRLPPAGRAPLIVLIHGGFWRPAYDRHHLGPMASALAGAGYVVAVPEYRRAGMAEEGWTGPFNDIASALDQVAAIAGPYGADTRKVTWAGHSAGGHLVLWAAARPGLPSGSPWRGTLGPSPATHVVSLAGCSSLRLCAEWNLGTGAVHLLMGGGPDDVPERYAVADPAALPAPAIPVTLIHGVDDDTVPLRMSQVFSAGRLVEIPGADHFDLIDPQSPAWPRVVSVLAGTGFDDQLKRLFAAVGKAEPPRLTQHGGPRWPRVSVSSGRTWSGRNLGTSVPFRDLMTRKGTASSKGPAVLKRREVAARS